MADPDWICIPDAPQTDAVIIRPSSAAVTVTCDSDSDR